MGPVDLSELRREVLNRRYCRVVWGSELARWFWSPPRSSCACWHSGMHLYRQKKTQTQDDPRSFKHILFYCLMKQIKCRDIREQVTRVSWKYKKCKTTLFLLIKTVLNKDEEYPTAHKTRSDPARLKDSSYTAPSEGTEASRLQISTKYSTQIQREMGSLGNSAHEPLVSKPF